MGRQAVALAGALGAAAAVEPATPGRANDEPDGGVPGAARSECASAKTATAGGGREYSAPGQASTAPPPKPAPKPQPVKVTPKKPAPVRVTVKKGDTLYGLSLRYKTTVAAIKKANGLKSDLIRPGQKLVVPR